MVRQVIQIDEDKCTGCGICANACHEGAIAIIDGKAKLTRDDYCDGMGDCLPTCPADAIHFVEREAAAYDADAVKVHMEERRAAEKSAAEAAPENTVEETAAAQAASENTAKAVTAQAGGEGTAGKAAAEAALRNVTEKAAAETAAGKADSAAVDTLQAALNKVNGMAQLREKPKGFTCPGTAMKQFNRKAPDAAPTAPDAGIPSAPGGAPMPPFGGPAPMPPAGGPAGGPMAPYGMPPMPPFGAPTSQLAQWPCQIKLVPVHAPFFHKAHLLIAADCTAYAYANMHREFMRGRVTVIGCPKLDSVDYSQKLTEIIRNNDIRDVTIVRMEVPCCGGLERAAIQAMKNSGKFLPWQIFTISTDGRLLED